MDDSVRDLIKVIYELTARKPFSLGGFGGRTTKGAVLASLREDTAKLGDLPKDQILTQLPKIEGHTEMALTTGLITKEKFGIIMDAIQRVRNNT